MWVGWGGIVLHYVTLRYITTLVTEVNTQFVSVSREYSTKCLYTICTIIMERATDVILTKPNTMFSHHYVEYNL